MPLANYSELLIVQLKLYYTCYISADRVSLYFQGSYGNSFSRFCKWCLFEVFVAAFCYNYNFLLKRGVKSITPLDKMDDKRMVY